MNIVFLLLVFLMLAGRVGPADPFEIEPPFSAVSTFSPDASITLLIDARGRMAVDGNIVAIADLTDVLAARAGTAGASGDVLIRAHGAVSASAVLEVVDRLRALDVGAVRLWTRTVR